MDFATPHPIRREDGFTLMELLITILIVAILAAIAIPSFLDQKGKANDADAKSTARTVETAMMTYATDHDGSYACGASAACLGAVQAIESSIPSTGVVLSGPNGAGDPTQTVFRVTVTGGDGRTFWLERDATAGTTTRGCALNGASSAGGCDVTGGGGTGTW